MLKKNVLRKNSEFSAVYNKGKSVGDRYVVLFYRPNGLPYNRTGFLASKKVGNGIDAVDCYMDACMGISVMYFIRRFLQVFC